MTNTISLIIGIILGAGVVSAGFWLGRKEGRTVEPKKLKGRKLIEQQAQEKKQNIEAILGLMESGNQPLTNNHVEQMLGIPESTVTRYFDELEKAGRVRHVGKTGQDVFYEKV